MASQAGVRGSRWSKTPADAVFPVAGKLGAPCPLGRWAHSHKCRKCRDSRSLGRPDSGRHLLRSPVSGRDEKPSPGLFRCSLWRSRDNLGLRAIASRLVWVPQCLSALRGTVAEHPAARDSRQSCQRRLPCSNRRCSDLWAGRFPHRESQSLRKAWPVLWTKWPGLPATFASAAANERDQPAVLRAVRELFFSDRSRTISCDGSSEDCHGTEALIASRAAPACEWSSSQGSPTISSEHGSANRCEGKHPPGFPACSPAAPRALAQRTASTLPTYPERRLITCVTKVSRSFTRQASRRRALAMPPATHQ